VTGRRQAVLVAGLMLTAFNLRAAFVAVSPVLGEVRRELGLSAPVAGLLTTLPTLCFGAFSALVPRLARRWDLDRMLVAALAVLAGGVLVRLLPSAAGLLAGTLILGAAMAVGNVLLPSLIKRDLPRSVGSLTGLYVMFMGAGATLAAGTTVLVERWTGAGWRLAISLWAVPALIALLACLPRLRARPHRSEAVLERSVVSGLWREPIALQLVTFMGLQSLIYYSATAWLPTLFSDAGMSESAAGLQLAAFNLIGLPASLAAPILASRTRDQVGLVLAACALTAAGLVGLVAAPLSAPLLWMTLLGLGQGATIGLALTMIGLRSPDAEHASELSGVVQSGGFLIAAAGPFALGTLHQATGSWALAFALPTAALVPMTLGGMAAARDRQVGPRPRGVAAVELLAYGGDPIR
jgi:MFS transporter, CP family, cyanate transporter